MSQLEHFEMLVLGSGEGGKYLAWDMAKSGHRTAVVERKLIGGSCPNTNCLPSKNEIWSAGVAKIVARAGEFGVDQGDFQILDPYFGGADLGAQRLKGLGNHGLQ